VKLELYGPAGLRSFVRNNLRTCQILLSGKYTVDELLTQHDLPTPCLEEDLHPNEAPGRDIWADEMGLWKGILLRSFWPLKVDAGPLKHRVPCIGYAFTEEHPVRTHIGVEGVVEKYNQAGSMSRRKVVICGDCSDASGISQIAMYPSILVHEATKAFMPPCILNEGTEYTDRASLMQILDNPLAAARSNAPNESLPDKESTPGGTNVAGTGIIDDVPPKKQVTAADVREGAIASGHSTPAMAGEFAHSIGARRLYLNHISTRFPAHTELKSSKIAEIERQAAEKFSGTVVSAHDMLSVKVPRTLPHPKRTLQDVFGELSDSL